MELDRDTLLRLYRTMTTIRHFEERGVPETGQRGMPQGERADATAFWQALPARIAPHTHRASPPNCA